MVGRASFVRLMVVFDFDVMGGVLLPHKRDAVLSVDADAVLPLPVPFERFQTICRGSAQVAQAMGSVEHLQFAPGNAPEGLRHTPGLSGVLAAGNMLGGVVCKGLNHIIGCRYTVTF